MQKNYIPLDVSEPSIKYQRSCDKLRRLLGRQTTQMMQEMITCNFLLSRYLTLNYNVLAFLSYLTEVFLSFLVKSENFEDEEINTVEMLLSRTLLFKASYVVLVIWRIIHIWQNKYFILSIIKARKSYLDHLEENEDIEESHIRKDVENLEYIMTAKFYIQHKIILILSDIYSFLLIAILVILVFGSFTQNHLFFYYLVLYLAGRACVFFIYIPALLGLVLIFLFFIVLPGLGIYAIIAIIRGQIKIRAHVLTIQRLPVKEYKSDLVGGKECIICLNDYEEGHKVIELKCNPKHHLHEICGKNWLEKNNSCPICRAPAYEI